MVEDGGVERRQTEVRPSVSFTGEEVVDLDTEKQVDTARAQNLDVATKSPITSDLVRIPYHPGVRGPDLIDDSDA